MNDKIKICLLYTSSRGTRMVSFSLQTVEYLINLPHRRQCLIPTPAPVSYTHLAKTLSAFANTDGGKLLIGVKDNGKIAGVRPHEELYMIDAAAGLYCSPEVNYTMQTYQVEGRSVLEVQIEESDRKPVYAKDETGKYLAYLLSLIHI